MLSTSFEGRLSILDAVPYQACRADYPSPMFPEALRPTSIEPFQISPSTVIDVPRALPTFQAWHAALRSRTGTGGRSFWNSKASHYSHELVILRHFQRTGWDGAWIDTYRGRTLSGIDQPCEIPSGPRSRLTAIFEHAGSSSGWFDVFAWRADGFAFAEAKRCGRDRVRASQVSWLASALAVGVPLGALLVVEWSLRVA